MQKERIQKEIINIYDKASDLCYDFVEIYFDEYKELLNAKRNKMQPKYDTVSLFLET